MTIPANHTPFRLSNPNQAGADGRGYFVYYENADVHNLILVNMKSDYNTFYRTGLPQSKDATGVYSEWAIYTSSKTQKKYLYNTHSGQFLSTTAAKIGTTNYGVILTDDAKAVDIVDGTSNGYSYVQITCTDIAGNGNYFNFAPYWGSTQPTTASSRGYYGCWDTGSKGESRIILESTSSEVSNDIKAVVEKEVALAEFTYSAYVGDPELLIEGAPATPEEAKSLIASGSSNRNAAGANKIVIQTRTISTDKYYVIESAHTGFTTAGTYVLRASSDDANNNVRWGTYAEDDAKCVWRFKKLVDDASVNESAGSGWGSVNGTFNIYSLYNVARLKEGFVGITTWNNSAEFKNSCTLKDNYRPTDMNHAAAFVVAPVEANSTKFNILCNYYKDSSSRDNFTLGVSVSASVSGTSGNVTSYNAWGTSPTNPTLSQWKIREVAAPTLANVPITISAVKVATYYTAKTLSIPEGVTAKKVVDAQNPQQGDVYHLVYEELQNEIPAGTPVVLFGEADTYQFPRSLDPHDYVEISVDGSAQNRLIGTVRENATATGNGENGTLYALGNKNSLVAFYHFLGSQFTAGKAYLDAQGINGGSTSNVRAFAIFDEETGTVTNINSLMGDTTGEGTTFDLAGRRVNANIKGISIVNGKKVIR